MNSWQNSNSSSSLSGSHNELIERLKTNPIYQLLAFGVLYTLLITILPVPENIQYLTYVVGVLWGIQFDLPGPMYVTGIAVAHSIIAWKIFDAYEPTVAFIQTLVAIMIIGWAIVRVMKNRIEIASAKSDDLRDVIKVKEERIAKLEDRLAVSDQVTGEMETTMRQKSARLYEKSVKLSTLLFKVQALAGNMNFEEILDNVIDILVGEVGAVKCSVMLVDQEKEELYTVKSYGLTGEEQKVCIPVGSQNFIGWVAAKGLIMTPDIARQDPALIGLINKGPLACYCAAPLKTEGKIMGVINIGKLNEEGFGKNDRMLLNTTATIAGLSMNTARVFDQTREDLQSAKKMSEQEMSEKKKIRDMFNKYVAPQIVDRILKTPEQVTLGGEKQRVTVMFADIRNFTTMSEQMAPELVVEILNAYLSVMTETVLKHEGTLDKYMGDALMAIFGVPLMQEDDPVRAVRSALEMKEKVNELNRELGRKAEQAIKIGIGISTGNVVVGNIGSERRMDYTVVGDTVNMAARLEAEALGDQVLVTQATYRHVEDLVEAKDLGPIKVKGKSIFVPTYLVMGFKEAEMNNNG